MSTNHNRIKVADLETNQSNQILTTNIHGELEFTNIDTLITPSQDPVTALQPGIVDNTPLQELGGADKLVNNVRLGIGAGTGTGNTVLGANALYNNTTGSSNTAVGEEALAANTIGEHNTACGNWALRSNVSGVSNEAFGENALANNVSGSANTAIGYNSLGANVTSPYNVAIGTNAMGKLPSGLGQSVAIGSFCMYDATATDKNVAIGTYSLRYNTNGFSNTALGHTSLGLNTSGNSNNAFGNYSLGAVTTGAANIGMGKFAGRHITTGSSNIYIGSEGLAADATLSGIINIGNKIISNANNLVIIPAQTNALIASDNSGKAIATKEYVLSQGININGIPALLGGNVNFTTAPQTVTILPLTNNYLNNTTTRTSVTGWNFSVLTDKRYKIEIIGTYQTGVLTTGCSLGFILSSGTGTIQGIMNAEIAQTTSATGLRTTIRAINNSNSTVGSFITTTGVSVINSPHYIGGILNFKCTSSGTFEIQFASEIGSSTSQLNADSLLLITEY